MCSVLYSGQAIIVFICREGYPSILSIARFGGGSAVAETVGFGRQGWDFFANMNPRHYGAGNLSRDLFLLHM